MKKLVLYVALLCPIYASAQFNKLKKNVEKASWIYFDLGDTVIDTKDMKHLHYLNGAREYLEDLKRNGFKVGLITNIPETWGTDYQEKFQTLKKMISDGWSEASPFDWTVFDEVILPLKNEEMKPKPTMYMKAINRAEGCPCAFVGENSKEVEAANSFGMAGKLFVANDPELYIPVDKVNEYLKENYKRGYDRECILE
ncbi:MAG: HAD family hydrolase [Bdellovibrio sp.]